MPARCKVSVLAAVIVCLLTCIPISLDARADDGIFFRTMMSENVRIEKGLSQNSVYSIFQDHDGYMWLGTWDGLNRWDAYNFTTFSKEQGLTNETIHTIFQDGDWLWVGTENGLNAIHMTTAEVRNYYSDPSDSTTLTHNWINHIYKDSRGRLWICTAAGLNEYVDGQDHFRHVFSRDYGNPMRSNYFNSMQQDADSNYWIATNYGLVYFESLTNRVTRYFSKPGDDKSLPSNQIHSILTDETGRVWIGTARGLAYYDSENRHFINIDIWPDQAIKMEQPAITALAWESGKGLWAGTNGEGLFLIHQSSMQISHYKHTPGRPSGISDNRIQSLYIDRQGIIWIGTFNGLNKVDRNAPRFKLLRSNPTQANTLHNNSIWCFLETAPGKVWIGTDEGISLFDRIDHKFSRLTGDNPQMKYDFEDKQVRSLFRDQAGNTWIGTRNSGLYVYNQDRSQTQNFIHERTEANSLSDNYIFDIAGTADSNIWIATNHGLNRYNKAKNKFYRYFHQPDQTNTLPHNKIYNLFVDPYDRLWVSTAAGLSMYRNQSDDFVNYAIPADLLQQNPVYTNHFFSLTYDRTGSFWIGSRGGGLVGFTPETGQFQIYTHHDGLPSNVVYKALIDSEKKLWLTTNWGLSRFDPIENMFINYEVTDGLQSNEFNLNAAMIASNGEIYAGGLNGFNIFSPESIKVNTQPPPVRITAFKKFNELQKQKLRDGDTIRLNYHDNFFSFEFAALDFTNPSKNKYRFMLENYDADWIDRNADKRFAEYAKMNPGTYRFTVQASNSDGFWNEKGTSLTIIIKPPWYATNLFRIMLAIALLMLLYFGIQMRTRAVSRKHEVEKNYLAFEKQLFELEQKALQLQMNPHFLFNSLNSIQSFVLNNDTDNAIRYLSKFSQLMRRTLANSRESMIPLRDEIQALTLYLEIEKLRFDEKFGFTIHLDPNIDDSYIEIPPMILQPYVENAIIHGLMHTTEKGLLRINISLEKENIICVIEDNGVGREKAAEIKKQSGIERKSRGMLITKERLEILNLYSKDQYTVKIIDLKDGNGKATGTRVEVRLMYKDL